MTVVLFIAVMALVVAGGVGVGKRFAVENQRINGLLADDAVLAEAERIIDEAAR